MRVIARLILLFLFWGAANLVTGHVWRGLVGLGICFFLFLIVIVALKKE